MLTWEGEPILGAIAITEKITVRRSSTVPLCYGLTRHKSLPFKSVQHKVTTLDAQPLAPLAEGSILVSVTGLLVVRYSLCERLALR
jgi:hypothetical protein